MDWKAVIDNLRAKGIEDAKRAEAVRTRYSDVEHDKTVERLRINANFCLALADALTAGLEGAGGR